MLRSILLSSLTALLVPAALAVAPTAARAATYGYSTNGENGGAQSEILATCTADTVPCPSVSDLTLGTDFSDNSTYPNNGTYWNDFATSVLPSGYVRFWIPYDALDSYSTSTGKCIASPFSSINGTQEFDNLIWSIQYANAQGWIADVQIAGGSGDGGVPEFPQPTYGNASYVNYWYTTAGFDYSCGVKALFQGVHNDLPSVLVQWEVMNEPDSAKNPNETSEYEYEGSQSNACPSGSGSTDGCGTPPSGVNYDLNGALCASTSFTDCGPLEAAELWEIAKADNSYGDRIAALTSDYPHTEYANETNFNYDYIAEVNDLYNCASGYSLCYSSQYPTYWSVHDYNDPTGLGTQDLSFLDSMLSTYALKSARVWVTESGDWLADYRTYDDNYPNGVSGCTGDETSESNTIGCITDDNASQQDSVPAEWRALENVSATNVTTTQVYWYQIVPNPGWDSAFLDQNGNPRPVYCNLVTSYQGSCNSSNIDDYHDS